ncbi:hypothetical protein CK203_101931 [Vitis vinifera]|uniref:Uncharacterized protein n=1 Tax=Vitis vinifera TaxID=29760 RepID=A0A438BQ41_VITVI|nr:hypothetical protein CK203_101931 [Vitis vinifera]
MPTSYLGLPLGANHKSVAVWNGMEERFRKRLAMWKRQFISKGGRITPIRSTLSRPSYVSGIGALRMKGRLFGGMSLVGSLGRKKRVGILEKLGRASENVKFWKDNWCGNFALCNSFPSLYAFASYKEAWLVELWDPSGEEGVWSPKFSRPFNDWEVEEVERLLLTIRGRRLNPLLEGD